MYSRLAEVAKWFWTTTTPTSPANAPKAAASLADDGADAENPVITVPPKTVAIEGDNLQIEQKKLEDLNAKFLLDIKAWEKLRDDILATDKQAEDAQISLLPVTAESHLSLLQRLKQALMDLILPPEIYLREHLQPCCEKVKKLAQHLDDLLRSVENEHLVASKRATLVEICNTSLDIFRQFNEMIKTIQSEINYCLGIDRVAEKIVQGLILYATTQIPYGALRSMDVNLAPAYREMLYKKIRKEVDDLCMFMTQVENAVNDGKHVCSPASLTPNASLRRSGVFPVPAAPAAVNTPQAEPSTPALAK